MYTAVHCLAILLKVDVSRVGYRVEFTEKFLMVLEIFFIYNNFNSIQNIIFEKLFSQK